MDLLKHYVSATATQMYKENPLKSKTLHKGQSKFVTHERIWNIVCNVDEIVFHI